MPPDLIGEPNTLNLMSSENIVDIIIIRKNNERIRNSINAGFFLLKILKDISFFLKNLKNMYNPREIKISLNKITRVQFDGIKAGGNTIIGKNKAKQIIPKKSFCILSDELGQMLFFM